MRRVRALATVVALIGLALVAPAAAAPAGAAVPTAPTDVSAVAFNHRATVKWVAPVADGGSPITGYQVTPIRDGVAQPVRSFPGDDTRRSITGLANGATYTFTVRAVNADGVGPESAPSNAVIPASWPSVVAHATALAGDESATVRWTAPDDDGGLPVTRYEIRAYWGFEHVATVTVPPTERSAVVTGLDNGSQYDFAVQAVNDVGTGPSSPKTRVVTPKRPPDPSRPYSSWSQMIWDVHLVLRGFGPDTVVYDTWVPKLEAGTATTGDFVAAQRGSADNRTMVDPVVRLYQAYYLRMPDQDGLAYWIGQRRGGRSLVSISAFFARSSEFTTLYGSLTDRQFVELIYQNILGRPGEPAGVDYWTDEITSGRRTRGEVMLGFSESAEYRSDQASEVTIAVLYLLWLERPPTADERQRALAALDGGQTVAAYALLLRAWAPFPRGDGSTLGIGTLSPTRSRYIVIVSQPIVEETHPCTSTTTPSPPSRPGWPTPPAVAVAGVAAARAASAAGPAASAARVASAARPSAAAIAAPGGATSAPPSSPF